MKTKKIYGLLIVFVAITVFSFVFISCSKKENLVTGTGTPSVQLTKEQKIKQNIRKLIRKLPNKVRVDGRTIDMSKDGFNFSDPSDGVNYSTNIGVTYSEDNHIMYISSTSLGGGFGGTVVVGNTTMDINYTLCFSEADSSADFNFFGGMGGVSSVIGISGDFTHMPNSLEPDSTENEGGQDFTEFFKGFAAYVVYDGQASGDYEIVNLLENNPNGSNNSDSTGTKSNDFDWENKGFAFGVDFVNDKLFISAEGILNVSGGTIMFNGKYLCVSGFAHLFSNQDETNNDDLEYTIVDGYGSMGCQ